MGSADKNESSTIKIVDRRRFTPEGASRDNHAIEDRKKPVVAPATNAAADKARSAAPPGAQGAAPGPQKPSDFLPFVASLATNAMAALGALPQAQARGMPVDHEMAREYIDIIAMLQERTVGNLSADEDQALKRLLGELKRGYVEATQKVSKVPMPAAGFPPGMRR
jgi:hypothetical protein